MSGGPETRVFVQAILLEYAEATQILGAAGRVLCGAIRLVGLTSLVKLVQPIYVGGV